jgi:hypothetical protein
VALVTDTLWSGTLWFFENYPIGTR